MCCRPGGIIIDEPLPGTESWLLAEGDAERAALLVLRITELT